MGVLEVLVIVLFVFWIGGFALHLAGAYVHLLLVAAVVVLIYRFFTTRKP